jgi:hypothetical protein
MNVRYPVQRGNTFFCIAEVLDVDAKRKIVRHSATGRSKTEGLYLRTIFRPQLQEGDHPVDRRARRAHRQTDTQRQGTGVQGQGLDCNSTTTQYQSDKRILFSEMSSGSHTGCRCALSMTFSDSFFQHLLQRVQYQLYFLYFLYFRLRLHENSPLVAPSEKIPG